MTRHFDRIYVSKLQGIAISESFVNFEFVIRILFEIQILEFLNVFLGHSLIVEELRQIWDTKREIFSTNVTFNAESDGVVQIFNFLCAKIIKT